LVSQGHDELAYVRRGIGAPLMSLILTGSNFPTSDFRIYKEGRGCKIPRFSKPSVPCFKRSL